MKKRMLALLFLAASIVTSMAQTIVDTGFTSPYVDGDLAGQQGWIALPTTGVNAFDVTDSAGSGFADTVGTSLDTNSGNYVYLDSTALGSAAGDEWDGVMDFTVSTTIHNLDFSDFFRIGVISTATNAPGTGSNQAMLRLRSEGPTGRMSVRAFREDGNVVIMSVDGADLGWNPAGADTLTDDLRLSWKLRETTVANTYTLICSLENLSNPSTNSAAITMVATNAYAASGLYTVMGRPNTANINDTEETINITIDSLSIIKSSAQPVKLYPTPVTALAGNGFVNLSWVEVTEATSYDVKRSDTIDGTYATLVSDITTNGYQDTTVVNGNEYYYKVTSVNGAVTADSDPVQALPDTAITGDVLDTSFAAAEGYADGDLDGQQGWMAIPVSAPEAFNVISTGDGYAETATFFDSFNNALSGQLFYNKSITNNNGGAWNGTLQFRLEGSPNPGVFKTNITASVTNIQEVAVIERGRIFDFGLTADTDTLLDFGADDVLISMRTDGGGNIAFHFNDDAVDDSMLLIPRDVMGWDPQWVVNNATNAPVFNSKWVTLDWTIRKTDAANIYAGVVDATIDGVTYSGNYQFTDDNPAPAAYSAEALKFGISHDYEANGVRAGATNGIININLDALSLSHTNAMDLPATPPYNVVSSLGNLQIMLEWDGGFEADSFDIYRSDTDSESLTFLANVTTNTFTDSGLTDMRTYIYQIYAVYPGPVTSPPSDMLAVRALGQSVAMGWGPSGDIITGGNKDASMTASSATNGIVNVLGSGTDGSAFDAAIYNTNAAPLLYHTLQYPAGSAVAKNLLLDRSPNDYYRLDIDVPVPAEMGWSSLKWIEGGSVNAVTADPAIEVNSRNSHVAVRNGSTWYVSETLGDGEFTIMDLNAENWAELEVATATSSQIMTVVGASFAPVPLTDITAIGLFQDNLDGNQTTESFRMLVGSKPSEYDLWTDQYAIYNEQAARTNDYDEDGFDNAWEWGLGGNPTDSGDVGIVDYTQTGLDESGKFICIYPRLKDANARPDYFLTESDNLQYTLFANQQGDYTIIAGGTWTNEPDFEVVTNAIPTTDAVKFIKLNIE